MVRESTRIRPALQPQRNRRYRSTLTFRFTPLLGKAILAYLPAEERERAIADGLTSFTEKTITDRDELEDELQSVRDRRTAFEREEFTEGYQCVGSPIIGSNAQPVGAVSVSGSTAEMTGKRLEEDMTGLVVSTAKSIENETLSE